MSRARRRRRILAQLRYAVRCARHGGTDGRRRLIATRWWEYADRWS